MPAESFLCRSSGAGNFDLEFVYMSSGEPVRRAARLRNVRTTTSSAVLFIAAILGMGCAKPQAAAPPREAVPVLVGKVIQKAMPVQLTAIGNVEAYSTISIRAQVPGGAPRSPLQGG